MHVTGENDIETNVELGMGRSKRVICHCLRYFGGIMSVQPAKEVEMIPRGET